MAKRTTYLRKVPDYSQPSKAELRAIGTKLVDKYLRSKKKGCTITKCPKGRTSIKSYAWR